MDSELLTCLLKFIEYFPDYLSALSRTLVCLFWTTFVETAVHSRSGGHGHEEYKFGNDHPLKIYCIDLNKILPRNTMIIRRVGVRVG